MLNEKLFEYLEIPTWHNAGYTGEGISLAELELDVDVNLPFFNNKVVDKYGECRAHGHGGQVMDLMHQVAPNSIIHALRYSYNTKTKQGTALERIKFIADNVDICGASKVIGSTAQVKEWLQQAKDNDVILIGAAGNEYGGKMMDYTKDDLFWAISAIHEVNGEHRVAHYNSTGEEMDFASFSSVEVHTITPPYKPMEVIGTSFAQPIFTGMMALVQHFFVKNIGRKLTISELHEFVKDNCVDVGKKGFDVVTGYGLFRLPNPDSIDINKYKEGDDVNNPQQIVVHHSATKDGVVYNDFDSIKQGHINKGYRDIGYHYVIEYVDNKVVVHKGRAENEVGAHTIGFNTSSIGICVIGNYMNESPSEAILNTLVDLIKDIRSRYGNIPVGGHRDYNATSCPGDSFPMNRLQQLLTQEVNVMLNFKDKDQISDYAKAHVERAIDFGIMNGIGDNLFDPKVL